MTTTGTISENYLKENELESMLANHDERYATLINIDEYREQIEDVKSENRFDNLVKLAVQNNINKNDAEDFLIKQAAFDMLTGNVDRLGNPSNFIFVYNQETKQGRMVNFDYGRCLPIPTWVQRSEENFKDEYIDEDKSDLAKSWIQGNKSILSGKTLSEQKQFLKDHGFTGFHLNVDQFEQDLDELKDIFKKTPFEKYTKMKVEAFKEVVRQNLNTLIFDTSLSKDDFLAITETRQNVTNV